MSMKKSLLAVFLLLLLENANSHAQDSLTCWNFREGEIGNILSLDIYNYFSNLDTNDTKLKKARFQKTDDYRVYTDSLKAIRDSVLSKKYLTNIRAKAGQYDMNSRSISIELKMEPGVHDDLLSRVIDSKSIYNDVCFPQLPVSIRQESSQYEYGCKDVHFLISFKVSEDDAVTIENKEVDVELRFWIQPSVRTITEPDYFAMMYGTKKKVAVSKTLEAVLLDGQKELSKRSFK